MKKAFLISLFSLVSLLSTTAFAVNADNDFWMDLHDFVLKCAVQPYAYDLNGNKVYSSLRSTCRELKVTGNNAVFTLHGEKFQATLSDSEVSDGGDLNDLAVRSVANNRTFDKTYVLAFGDILLAMAGGDNSFRQVYDPNLMVIADE